MESLPDHKQGQVRRLFWAVAGLLLISAAIHAAPPAKPAPKPSPGQGKTGKIVKWVDHQGVTHYGDRLPAEYADHANSVISSQGNVLKKNEAPLTAEEKARRQAEEKQLADRQRSDKALLSTYTSEQEIDIARDRNLLQEASAIQLLDQQIADRQKKLAGDKKFAEDLKARKKPLPPDLQQEMDRLQQEIARLQEQAAQKRSGMEATRQRFEEDKRRYRDIQSQQAASGSR